jgi:hypothetical protein
VPFATGASGWPFTIRVTDAQGATLTRDARVTATVEQSDDATVTPTVVEPPTLPTPVTTPPPLTLSTGWLPRARVGATYKARVGLDNATPGVVWRVKGTLPKGLRLKPSRDGTRAALVGEPTTKGTYTFTVKVRDGSGHVASRSYTVRVRRR